MSNKETKEVKQEETKEVKQEETKEVKQQETKGIENILESYESCELEFCINNKKYTIKGKEEELLFIRNYITTLENDLEIANQKIEVYKSFNKEVKKHE